MDIHCKPNTLQGSCCGMAGLHQNRQRLESQGWRGGRWGTFSAPLNSILILMATGHLGGPPIVSNPKGKSTTLTWRWRACSSFGYALKPLPQTLQHIALFSNNSPTALWTVFHFNTGMTTCVTSALRMKGITLAKWQQLPKIGKHIGEIGPNLSNLWDWTLSYRGCST